VQAVEENRRQKAWMKRQRMLRKLEPQELKEALADVMATRGLRRPLRKLWEEFVAEFNGSDPERRQSFFVDCPDWVAQVMEVAQAITPPP
jgi:NTP pyrophosphatase (non-canonical NTP hydrolase)